MRYRVAITLLVSLLSACTAITQRPIDQGFYNYTSQPTSVLLQQWHNAQDIIATQPILIDAAAVAVYGDAANAIYKPADVRALDLAPWGVKVEEKHGTGEQHTIDCGGGPAYSCVPDSHTVWVSDWWMENYPQTVEYEFENLILEKLGYDISAR